MSTIRLRRSSVPGKVPTVEQLALGELAINTVDGKMYLKKNVDTLESIVQFIGSIPVDNTIFVQKGGSDDNSGKTWSEAVATIEKAVELADERGELTLIDIAPGVYETEGHIDLPDNTLIRAAHRSVIIRPVPGFEERNVFRMGSGCFIEGPVFEGWRLDDLENPSEGFAISFRPGANIRRTPYAHKIVVRTNPFWTTVAPPLDRNNANPLVGRGAGVVLADASILNPNSIYPSIMTWGATPVSHNGIGYVAKNGGLINAVNAVSMWAHKHFLALSGGQIVLSSCSTQFGDFTMVASGTRDIVVPYETSVPLTIRADDALLVDQNKQDIVDDLWDELVAESFTTGWTADDEAFTKRDAASVLQSIYWTLLTANDKPMSDLAKGFFNTSGNRVFTETPYDFDKTVRDSQLITDAVKYDIAFNSNARSINAALAFYRANSANLLSSYETEVLLALTEQKNVTASYLSGTSLTRSNNLFDEIIDIVTNGPASADPYVYNDPVGFDSGYLNARRLLISNKTFIQDEIDAWIAVQIAGNISPFNTGFVYDVAACRRDVGLIIEALRYDLTYGGNLETYNAAMAYFVGATAQYGADEKMATMAALMHLKNVVLNVVQGISISKSAGNISIQDTSGPGGSELAAVFAQNRIDDIIGTIDSNGRPPARLFPSIAWTDTEFQNSFNLLTQNELDITTDTVYYLVTETKERIGAFVYAFEFLKNSITNLVGFSSEGVTIVDNLVKQLIKTLVIPQKTVEPSTITAIGHTWTAIMAGVALTKIPPARNETTIEESILELDRGVVIASGQDDQGSALFIGGMKIDSDTGELTGPPFEQSVNRIATRAAIARSF